MELNKSKFALAGAEVMGVWYVVCALFVALWPELAMKLFGWIVHLVNLEAGVASFPEVIYGFAEVVILTYITAYVFAWLHNRAVIK